MRDLRLLAGLGALSVAASMRDEHGITVLAQSRDVIDVMDQRLPERRRAVPAYAQPPRGSRADHPHENTREIQRRKRQQERLAAKREREGQ